MRGRIEETVGRLRAAGAASGDRVGVICEPCREMFVLTLACWRMGATIVPVSTRYPAEKVRDALESVGCGLVLGRAVDGGPRVQAMGDFVDGGAECGGVGFEELGLEMEAGASIIFTSGSSGEPKGVFHTMGNHYYSALGSNTNIPFGGGDGWLASLAMYHVGGFSLIGRALTGGGRIVFGRAGETLAESIMRCDVTHVSLVPTQLLRLLEAPGCVNRLRGLKAILLGGEAISAKLLERAAGLGLPVCISYGCTEAASQVATSAPGRLGEGAKVLPYRELKIAADGEICLRGRTLFAGYVRGEAIDESRDEDGWFHTQDVGEMERDGSLRVKGRKDLMFVSGGENVHPEEIERAMLSVDGVERAAVVDVEDAEFIRRPVAFVKVKDNGAIDGEAIRAALGERLERFKIPKAIHAWPEWLSEALKPSRQRLREIASGL